MSTCPETAKTISPGGALDASETAMKRAGVAEYFFRGAQCGIKFNSYEEKYRYLRGKAVCDPTITFPCCTTSTQACTPCEESEPT